MVGPVRRDLVDDRVHARSPGADADLGHARLAAHDVVDDRAPRGGPDLPEPVLERRAAGAQVVHRRSLPYPPGMPRTGAHRRGATCQNSPMPQYDLPLDEMRRYTPDLPEPDDLEPFWDRTLAEARAPRPRRDRSTPVDTGLTLHRDVRRRVRRASAAHRSRAGSTCRPGRRAAARGRRVHRLRRRARPAARAGAVGGRGLCLLRDGHARPGLDVVRRRRRPTRTPTGAPSHPGFMTRGILDARRLLLPAGLHRCRARGRGGPAPPADRPGPGRGHRREPGRRHQPGRRRASCPTSPRPCPTCRSCATSRARSRCRTRTRTRRSAAT